MRLWHEDIIKDLPRQQLLGQHRECCALRGAGWGEKHATVDYVFTHPFYKLYQYHMLVMDEMESRGYHPNEIWRDPTHRGKNLPHEDHVEEVPLTAPIYPEHDEKYMKENLDNLAGKGIYL